MEYFYDSWILEFEFSKLMTLQNEAGEHSDGDKDEDIIKAKSKLKLGFIYSSIPNETFYEIELGEGEKGLLDISKFKENENDDQPPFLRINYEQSVDEVLEAILSTDEVVQWYEDFTQN